MPDNGLIQVDIFVENAGSIGPRRRSWSASAGTASMLTCVPAAELDAHGVVRERMMQFQRSDLRVVSRWVGTAFVRLGDRSTIDMLVFGEAGDIAVLGWRTLSGLNLTIDPISNQLVDSGPAPAAAA